MQRRNELVILTAVRAFQAPSGRFTLTQKYLEGTAEFARHWPGPVTTLAETTATQSTDFDHVELTEEELRGTFFEERPEGAALLERLQNAAAVLSFLSRDTAALAAPLKAAGVPLVYIAEYTPRTEKQIIRAGTTNPIKRLRRMLWLSKTTRLRDNAAGLAAGIQCSGVPIYEYYKDIQPNRHLFFDNRIWGADVIGEDRLATRLARLESGAPLRLIFGGRFLPMKGVMALPEVAAKLKAAGVPFQMDIYGDGPLKDDLEAAIVGAGLGDQVRLQAPVDFRSGWMPTLQDEMDLFLCTHIQGDPSSTYPEVMSCGVPMLGFDNEAFLGIVKHASVGWQVPTGDAGAMAAKIIELNANRGAIAEMARKGLGFARQTAFEETFEARAKHLISASRLG